MNKINNRQKRKLHIRKTVRGTAVKPRIFVFKSNKYFYAGLADDDKQVVIMSKMCKKNSDEIKKMGKIFAGDFKKKKLEVAVFDRSGYRYHGLIATFADELRSNGVKI